MNTYIVSAVVAVVAMLVGGIFISANNSSAPSTAQYEGVQVVVHKDPSCGCCGAYVSYMRNAGFEVQVKEGGDMREIKSSRKVPVEMSSCHTTDIAGYTVEGHVPHEVISDLLTEKPDIDGIALAGMPAGSPGMPGTVTEPLEITTFAGDAYPMK